MELKSLSIKSPTAFAIAVSVILIISYSILLGIGSFLVAGASSNINSDNRLAFFGVLALSQFLILGGGAILIVRWIESDPREVFSMRLPASPKFYLFAVVGVVGILIANDGLINILLAVLPESWASFLADSYNSDTQAIASIIGGFSPYTFLYAILAIAVAPAISEELLFRGFLLSKLRTKQSNLSAIVISGLLFGAIHFSLVNMLPLSALGMFLAFITIRSGSILPAVIIHFLNNLSSVISVLASNGMPELMNMKDYASIELTPFAFLIGGLGLIVISLIILHKLPIKADSIQSKEV